MGLTALLFTAAEATQSVGLLLAASFSIVVLFFVALAGAERLMVLFTEKVTVKKWHVVAVIVVFSIATPYFVIEIIGALLEFGNA